MEIDRDLCRICLRNAGMPGLKNVNIFQTVACEDLVANLLIDCADVEVYDGDGCPQIICTACLISLEQAYNFKNLIRQSDRILKARLEENDTFEIEILEEAVIVEEESVLPEVQNAVKSEITETIEEWVEEDDVNYPSPKHELVDEEMLIGDEDAIEELQHIVQKTVENITSNCCVCGYDFEKPNDLKEHMYEVHDIDPNSSPVVSTKNQHPCLMCRVESFPSRALLRKHQRANIKQLCSVCGGAYTQDALKQHMKLHRVANEMNTKRPCPFCNKLVAGNQMWVHKKTHMEEAPFECHICGKTFKLKNYLKNHVVRHFPALSVARERKFECEYCHKMFENAYKLDVHYSVHTGEKRYQCEYCDSKFKNTTDRRRHQWLVHTGSPYNCQRCHKQFDRPSLLKNHENNCQRLYVEILEQE